VNVLLPAAGADGIAATAARKAKAEGSSHVQTSVAGVASISRKATGISIKFSGQPPQVCTQRLFTLGMSWTEWHGTKRVKSAEKEKLFGVPADTKKVRVYWGWSDDRTFCDVLAFEKVR